jgi:hypothetical protein
MATLPRFCLPLLFIAGATTLPAAFAQTPVADPKACSNTAQGPSNQNLSDKLGRTNGVICPPNVDPSIKAPTPHGGSMPVIPPPGSPGGDPSVQPK